MTLSPIVLRNYDQSMSSLGNRFVLFLGYRSASHKNCMSVWRNPSVHVSSWLERSATSISHCVEDNFRFEQSARNWLVNFPSRGQEVARRSKTEMIS